MIEPKALHVIPAMASKYGATLPDDLANRLNAYTEFRRMRDAVDVVTPRQAAVEALGTASFDKAMDAYRQALAIAAVETDARNNVRNAAEVELTAELGRRTGEVIEAFRATEYHEDAVRALAQSAPLAPLVARDEVLGHSPDAVSAYVQAEAAWDKLGQLASDLDSLYDGWSMASHIDTARVPSVVLAGLPAFTGPEHVGQWFDAARGRSPFDRAHGAVAADISALVPALLYAVGADGFGLRTPAEARRAASHAALVNDMAYWQAQSSDDGPAGLSTGVVFE